MSFRAISLYSFPTLLAAVLGLALSAARTLRAADSKLDPVKLDNADARVLVVTSAPGAKSGLHEHKMNRVMIYLDPGKMTLTDEAGGIEKLNFKAGEALWSPATIRPHVSLNESEHPVRIIEIELKSPGVRSADPRTARTDWVKAEAKRCSVAFENDQVRVVRVRIGAHEKGLRRGPVRHSLVAYVAVARVREKGPDGVSKIATHSAGDVAWGSPGTFAAENLGEQPIETVVVEFKPVP